MGVIVLGSLLLKRAQEKPKRKWKVWLGDVGKQVVGQAFVHSSNVLISGTLPLSRSLNSIVIHTVLRTGSARPSNAHPLRLPILTRRRSHRPAQERQPLLALHEQHCGRYHPRSLDRVRVPQALDQGHGALSARLPYWRLRTSSPVCQLGKAGAWCNAVVGAKRGTIQESSRVYWLLQAAVYVVCLGLMKVVVVLLFWAFPGVFCSEEGISVLWGLTFDPSFQPSSSLPTGASAGSHPTRLRSSSSCSSSLVRCIVDIATAHLLTQLRLPSNSRHEPLPVPHSCVLCFPSALRSVLTSILPLSVDSILKSKEPNSPSFASADDDEARRGFLEANSDEDDEGGSLPIARDGGGLDSGYGHGSLKSTPSSLADNKSRRNSPPDSVLDRTEEEDEDDDDYAPGSATPTAHSYPPATVATTPTQTTPRATAPVKRASLSYGTAAPHVSPPPTPPTQPVHSIWAEKTPTAATMSDDDEGGRSSFEDDWGVSTTSLNLDDGATHEKEEEDREAEDEWFGREVS